MKDVQAIATDLTDEEIVQEAKRLAAFLATHVGTVIATLSHRGVVVSGV